MAAGRSALTFRAAHLAALALLATGEVRAEELLPARQQALLLLRVLAYDRALPARAGDVATVAVAYRPGDRGGEARRDALLEALREVATTFSVRGLPVKVVAIPWSPQQFADRLRDARAAAVLLVGTLLEEAAPIAAASRRERVLSFTEDRGAVEAGVAVGLVHRGRRAGVIVNLAAARAEGADLEATLLAVAEVR